MKLAAMSDDPAIRKEVFFEYFERFGEFPSFLFDTEQGVDARLIETMTDLKSDLTVSDAMRKGIERLMERVSNEN